MPGSGGADAGSGTPAVPVGGTCESCGWPEEVLVAVRRVYLTFDRLGAVVGHREDGADERWCESCLATYPHRRT